MVYRILAVLKGRVGDSSDCRCLAAWPKNYRYADRVTLLSAILPYKITRGSYGACSYNLQGY